jgi:hypothetical protein
VCVGTSWSCRCAALHRLPVWVQCGFVRLETGRLLESQPAAAVVICTALCVQASRLFMLSTLPEAGLSGISPSDPLCSGTVLGPWHLRFCETKLNRDSTLCQLFPPFTSAPRTCQTDTIGKVCCQEFVKTPACWPRTAVPHHGTEQQQHMQNCCHVLELVHWMGYFGLQIAPAAC